MLLIKSEQYNIIIGYGLDKPYNTTQMFYEYVRYTQFLSRANLKKCR